MRQKFVVGIDIGTSKIKVVIAEKVSRDGQAMPKILGVGQSISRGVSRGYITSTTEAAQSIKVAVNRAEKTAGVKVTSAYAAALGVGLSAVSGIGTTIISRADLEISERDITLALEAAEATIPPSISQNKKIINIVPIEYKIDGKLVWGEAKGMKGQKLEVKALFITCFEHHLSNLVAAVEEAGIEVTDVVVGPVAASFVTLSKKEKRVGCVLIDIGAETTSIIVYENNNLVSLEALSIGGADITNDIALGLKISLDDAENVKLDIDRRIMYSKKKLEDIIFARLRQIFSLTDKHLRSIGRDGLLPGGSVITGGASATTGVRMAAEQVLKLPSQIAEIHFGTSATSETRDKSWTTALGLALVGLNSDDEQQALGITRGANVKENSERLVRTFKRWFSQFLP